MYEEKNKYIDVPSDDKQLIKIEQLYDTTKESSVIRDCEHLIMMLGNLSYPKFCSGWVDVETFNKLLDKYKIDVSIYQKGVEKPKEPNPSFDYIISIIKTYIGCSVTPNTNQRSILNSTRRSIISINYYITRIALSINTI